MFHLTLVPVTPVRSVIVSILAVNEAKKIPKQKTIKELIYFPCKLDINKYSKIKCENCENIFQLAIFFYCLEFFIYHLSMNDFNTITTKIKAILSQQIEGKVFDKDVATALNINPIAYATMKRRKSIPHKAILDYCVANHIDANDLLFSKPINNEVSKPLTIKYLGDMQASAGGGADGLDEGCEELTINEILSLFISRLDK